MAAATVFASCAKEGLEAPANMVDVTIDVSSNTDTKVSFDGLKLVWNTGDQISIINDKNQVSIFTYAGENGAAAGAFKGQLADGTKPVYAVYPASSEITILNKKVEYDMEMHEQATAISESNIAMLNGFEVPIVQNAVKGSFHKGSNVSSGLVQASGSNYSVVLKSNVALIKVTVPASMSDIKSITVSTASGDPLSSKFAIVMDNLDYCCSTDYSPEVTLQNEDGSALQAGDYYIAVLPTANCCDAMNESTGFENPQFIVKNMAGKIAHKTLKDAIELESGQVYTIPSLEGELTFKDCEVITLSISKVIEALGSHNTNDLALCEDLTIAVDGHNFVFKGFKNASKPSGFTKTGDSGWYSDATQNRVIARYYNGKTKVTERAYIQLPDAYDGYYLYQVHFCSANNNRNWEVTRSYPRVSEQVAYPCRLRGVTPDGKGWYNIFTKRNIEESYLSPYIIGTGTLNGDLTCTYVKE